jgi:hypothetical protein
MHRKYTPPVTRQEHWDDWCRAAPNNPGISTEPRRNLIEQDMQERFPGNYRVVADIDNDKWHMVFASPEDEMWFRLKYT